MLATATLLVLILVLVLEQVLVSDLKEGEEDKEEGTKKDEEEEETSLPSFSWRQKAQIPPPGEVAERNGWSVQKIPSPEMSSSTAIEEKFEGERM